MHCKLQLAWSLNETVDMNNREVNENVSHQCSTLEGYQVDSSGQTGCDQFDIKSEDSQTFISQTTALQSKLVQSPWSVRNSEHVEAGQNLLNTNEYQHKRLTDQLRIEKELFPNCIQAPAKYENKRKSIFNNKENKYLTFFPGEATKSTDDYKMENTVSYVQQWLNKNETSHARKPFADLNVNAQWPDNHTKENTRKHNNNVHLAANRKRTHFKTRNKEFSNKIGNRLFVPECKNNTPKKFKKEFSSHVGNSSHKKCDNDESGIFVDDDTIVIDDSQEVDKDKNAWLAVLEAHKNNNYESTSVVNSTQVSDTNNSLKQTVKSTTSENKETCIIKVPFFKRSAIIETCKYCRNNINSELPVPDTNEAKPVTITIDGDSFVTAITILRNIPNNLSGNTKCTVSAQTDDYKSSEDICVKDVNNCNDSLIRDIDAVKTFDTQSEDLFADDKKIFGAINETLQVGKCVVIEESDSDTDLDLSGPISVTADVHRSCEKSDYGVLSGIMNIQDHELKPRRRPRGHTPTSTNSSEKENYNPNRMKRRITRKKKSAKK